jgi:hypothetical protein
LALASSGLNIESLSPDALCPPEQETRRAVAARLGEVELEGTWHATYVLVHRTRGDFVSLKLFDPQSALKLERELPVQSGSCAALAGVIALVLESFFLRAEGLAEPAPVAGTPADSPAPQPSAAEPASAAESVVSSGSSSSEPLPAQPPQPARTSTEQRAGADRERTQFLADAEVWLTTAWLAPSLRFDRDWHQGYRLGGSVGFDLIEHETLAFEGTALSRRIPLSLAGQVARSVSSLVRLRGSVEILGMLELARTRQLAHRGSGVRLVPGLGGRFGAELFPTSAAQPFLELSAAWLFGFFAPAFEVGGHEVLKPPGLVLGLSLGVQTPF